jgi:aldehyde dehydrogenase (NAD+)
MTSTFARVQQAGAEESERAIAAAFRASVSSSATSAVEREMLPLRVGNIVSRRKNEIWDLLIEECGSAFSKARPCR